MNKLKTIFRDVLYVSKLTKTNKKKLTIFYAVVLSQVTAALDILIIVLFSIYLAGNNYSNDFILSIISFITSRKYLFPLFIVLRFLFIYIQSYLIKQLELEVQKNLKVYLLREVFEKRNYSVADAYFYLNGLSVHISFFYSNVTIFINSSLQIFAYTTYLFLSDSRIIFTFAIGAAILSFPSRYFIKRAREFMHKNYELTKAASQEIQRIIDNMFLIKILKKDDVEINRFKNIVNETNKTDFKNFQYGAINSFTPTFVTMFIFSILIVGTNLAKTITLEFIGVTLRLFQSLGSVMNAVNKISNSHVHIENFYKLDKNRQLINKKNFVETSSNDKYSIIVDDINFKYFNSEEYIFENLSIKIEKKTHNILTGSNGSGKSTLLGLISGVLYSQSGKITANQSNFGYIGAIPLIFTDTLRSNILYGNNLAVEDEEILILLKEIDTFKEESSYNLDRIVDNKSLSSGQMQKIAFVRALLSDMDMLLLDESTANLDELSRDKIFDILSDQEITIINSTHNPEKFKKIDNHYHIEIDDEKRYIIQKSSK